VTNPSAVSRPNWWAGFTAEASSNWRDSGTNDCADPGPQPPLDTLDPLNAGQSTTGYICWTITASDADSLEFFWGLGTLDAPRTTWFALH
jgi:hypothetical protein